MRTSESQKRAAAMSLRSTEATEDRSEIRRGRNIHQILSRLHPITKASDKPVMNCQLTAYETFHCITDQIKKMEDVGVNQEKLIPNHEYSTGRKIQDPSSNYMDNMSSSDGVFYNNHPSKQRNPSKPEDLTIQADKPPRLSLEPSHKKHKCAGFDQLPHIRSPVHDKAPHIPAFFSLLSPSLSPIVQSIDSGRVLGATPLSQSYEARCYADQYNNLLQKILSKSPTFSTNGLRMPQIPFIQHHVNIPIDSPPITPTSPAATSSRSDDVPAVKLSSSPRSSPLEPEAPTRRSDSCNETIKSTIDVN